MRTIPTGGALATLTMIALAGLPQAAQEPETRRQSRHLLPAPVRHHRRHPLPRRHLLG